MDAAAYASPHDASGQDRLAGTGDVDQTYVGGDQPGQRGRGAEGKALVLIVAHMDDTGIGRLRRRSIRDAPAASLDPAVQGTVESGSVVRTDGWGESNTLRTRGDVREIVRQDAEVGDTLQQPGGFPADALTAWHASGGGQS